MSRCLSLIALGALLVSGCTRPRTEPAHNVLMIVIDTLRADHVFDRAGAIDTPNLDRLAADGVAFERAFSHTSWTLPSHTALFSSRYPYQTGVVLNAQRVPEDLPLLAE